MYRNQWSGVPGTPQSQVLTIDGELNKKRGYLGAYIWNDQSNIIRKTGGLLTYAYNVELAEGQYLKAGLSVGVMQVGVDFSKVIAEDITESTLLQNSVSKASPDANFGLRYINKKIEFGLSSNHLMNHTVDFSEEANFKSASYQSIKNFFIHTAYAWDANDDFLVKPTLMLRSNQGSPLKVDLHVNTTWKDLVWVGLGYRQNYGVTINAGGNLTDYIALGYDYDIATTGIGRFAGGTHEFFLRFRLGGKRDNMAGALSDTLVENNTAEDHERLVSVENRIDGMFSDVDALTKKLDSLKNEVAIHESDIDSLKVRKDDLQSQISDNKDLMTEKLIELRKIKDQLNKDRSKIHDFVNLEHVELAEIKEFDTERWRYFVVLDTYTDINYAKFLQRVLKRDYGIGTTIEASNDYLIVYSKEVTNKEDALAEIKRLNSTVNKEYLADGAWVYHKRK